jgi:hypothetical protein
MDNFYRKPTDKSIGYVSVVAMRLVRIAKSHSDDRYIAMGFNPWNLMMITNLKFLQKTHLPNWVR